MGVPAQFQSARSHIAGLAVSPSARNPAVRPKRRLANHTAMPISKKVVRGRIHFIFTASHLIYIYDLAVLIALFQQQPQYS